MSIGMHAIDEYVDMLLSPAPTPDPAPVGSAPATAMPALAPAALPPAAAPTLREQEPAAGPAPSRWLRLRCGNQVYALELLKIR